ncbi:EAL domain-containing protein [Stutzerimonas stutzeri]|uniref:EAL domain-containing protein n=1 Tax=Stutzerimonas stutzeri TaxID=316 RepID=UPI00210973F2|nr:EAL domain-containing protein [Stutzerimonas stutzeri]
MLTEPGNADIARAIITLAETLKLKVIAEGVETAEQRQFLLDNGCKNFQGYLFGRPMPLEEFEERCR